MIRIFWITLLVASLAPVIGCGQMQRRTGAPDYVIDFGKVGTGESAFISNESSDVRFRRR